MKFNFLKKLLYILIFITSSIFFYCKSITVIPKPMVTEYRTGEFSINNNTKILIKPENPEIEQIANFFVEYIKNKTGLTVTIEKSDDNAQMINIILLNYNNKDNSTGEEGYILTVTSNYINLSADKSAGVFYGIQTICQLIKDNFIPCLKITDKPRFTWRGFMLDESRHFYGKEFIKKMLDLLSYHKMNIFHWHLTDDQGWRIEIKKYPKLTVIGAWREKDKTKYGGFYTQDEIKEIVEYAKNRYITIVPEIDIPGHVMALLASYPEYSCTGGPFKVSIKWGVHEDVLCMGNEGTFIFLKDIMNEITELFPSKYIHIGGDECHKTRWKECIKCQARIKNEGLKSVYSLQSYFTKRMEEILNKKGRKVIGWDEIMQGGISTDVIVMNWHSMNQGIEAAYLGNDYIAAPSDFCYLCYPSSFSGIEKTYSFEPQPDVLSKFEKERCLGLESVYFSEGGSKSNSVERSIWPGTCALAEIAWSPADERDFKEFSMRLYRHTDRLKKMNVEFTYSYGEKIGNYDPSMISTEFKELGWQITDYLAGNGIYELEPTFKSGKYGLNIKWISLLENGKEISRDTHDGYTGYKKYNQNNIYKFEINTFNLKSEYSIKINLASKGGTDSTGYIIIRKVEDQEEKEDLIINKTIDEDYSSFFYKASLLQKSGKYEEAMDLFIKGENICNSQLAKLQIKKDEKIIQKIKNDLIDNYAQMSCLYNDFDNQFEKALEVYYRANRIVPDTDNYKLLDAGSFASLWIGHKAFGFGEFAEAKKYYELSLALKQKNKKLSEIKTRCDPDICLRVLNNRISLGTIKPEYIQKFLVLYVKHIKVSFKDKDGKEYSADNITDENNINIKRSYILQELLKKFVETYTQGKLSLEYKRYFIDNTMTNIDIDYPPPKYRCKPDLKSLMPDISDLLYENAFSNDVILIYWDKTGLLEENNNRGGNSSGFPVIPYHINMPLRGFSEIRYKSGADFMMLFHEYFHSVESLFGYYSSDSEENMIYNYSKYNSGMSLYDYWEYLFSISIPKKIEEYKAKGNNFGWKQFSYSTRHQFKLSKKKYLYNKNITEKITYENRKKSWAIKNEADKAWENNDKELCDKLYKQAFELNPALYNYYKHFGDRAIQNNNFEDAVKFYCEYIKFIDSFYYAKKIGDIYQYNLKKIKEAIFYYEIASQSTDQEKEKNQVFFIWGYLLLMDKKYQEALEVFDRGTGFETDDSKKCLFYKGECLFRLGNETEGKALMLKIIDPENDGIFDEKSDIVKRYLKIISKKYPCEIIKIKNKKTNLYLYDNGDKVSCGNDDGDIYVWFIEEISEDYIRIINKHTGDYMHIENLYDYIQCDQEPKSGWFSAQWLLVKSDKTSYEIHNRWKKSNKIHTENIKKYAEHFNPPDYSDACLWVIEFIK